MIVTFYLFKDDDFVQANLILDDVEHFTADCRGGGIKGRISSLHVSEITSEKEHVGDSKDSCERLIELGLMTKHSVDLYTFDYTGMSGITDISFKSITLEEIRKCPFKE